MNIIDISIEKIGLSNRSRHALIAAGINKVEDLLKLNSESLSKIRNLGAKSIAEITQKISEYDMYVKLSQSKYFEAWIEEQEGKDFVYTYLKNLEVSIDVLDLLSPKAYNLLTLNNYVYLYQLVFSSMDELMNIPRMDRANAEEVEKLVAHYIKVQKDLIVASLLREKVQTSQGKEGDSNLVNNTLGNWVSAPENRDMVLIYVKENNLTLEELGLTNRGVNQLKNNGFHSLDEIVFLRRDELLNLRRMGVGTVNDILEKVERYFTKHEERIRSFCAGDESALWDDELIKRKILELYESKPFKGFSLNDYVEKLNLPEYITVQRLKKIIGNLLANRKLEYVDYRCYRIYDKFEDYFHTCSEVSERNKMFIEKKLQGYTLEMIGQEYGITREAVRQVIQKNIEKVRNNYYANTRMKFFDEDYYRYLYENYEVDREIGTQWIGIPESVWRYLELIDARRGANELQEALEDRQIDMGLRIKIKTYLNRDKICLDGVWINRRRSDIEDFLLEKLCQEDISYDDFTKAYNQYLKSQDVAYDKNIYFTEDVYATRKNRLSESRKLLWKFNEQMRYYDVDGQDYKELYDVLNLNSYKNIEISTHKFINDYPDLMKRYDIRNNYELHNLLRKIVKVEEYPEFQCCRMPNIRFGEFDRVRVLEELLRDTAPITLDDFADLIHEKYGYDKGAIISNYLPPLLVYYHQGVFNLEQNEMSQENRELLKSELTEEFYYMEEVKEIYGRLIPGADINDVNVYNLKKMGLTVLSNYVLTNYMTLDSYFEKLFTETDIVDLTPIKKRFTHVVMYYQKLMNMKRNLDVIEFEPDQIINIRKLERVGVSKKDIKEFCDQVYSYIGNKTYFSAKSLREMGFYSELYELGFSDWFYGSLLLADERFSFTQTLGTRIFYKGAHRIMAKDFIENIVNEYGSIPVLNLMTDLSNEYGCVIEDKWDLINKIQNSKIFHDKILDRLYANEELFYSELDMLDS